MGFDADTAVEAVQEAQGNMQDAVKIATEKGRQGRKKAVAKNMQKEYSP